MWQRLRSALFWLLILAIPAQGYAASTMLFCGLGQPQTAATAHDHGSMHGHDHAAATQAHDEAAFSIDQTSASADATQADQAPSHFAGGKCSVCASCSHGVAMTASSRAVDLEPAPEGIVASDFTQVFAFLTDGPERPPRSILA